MPTLNEEKGVGKTIDSINREFFRKNNWELEIIVVDGGSKDKTCEIARTRGAKVVVEKRRGYGRAYKTGIPHATGDVIVTGDADATYPFDKVHEYIEILLKEHLDFITTNRFAKLKHGSMSIKHRFGNMILAFALRILFCINIKDSQSGMWIFKRDALKKIQPLEDFDDGMPFSEEIKIEMFTSPDIKAREIPSTLYTREGEVKLQSFRDGWKNLKFLFKKRVTL
ncbi:MAG: glycosyltransferase family 2 protein [Thermoplasmata archaeon]|nr:MAG: glycosyltransferase family 2 protein [Thermoplasmata archaeon]RLF35717.1 MAG: glycosyltransferase family 2 protein [Thermoplasmata archaeon]